MNNKLIVIGKIQGDNLADLKQWCNKPKSLLKPEEYKVNSIWDFRFWINDEII